MLSFCEFDLNDYERLQANMVSWLLHGLDLPYGMFVTHPSLLGLGDLLLKVATGGYYL